MFAGFRSREGASEDSESKSRVQEELATLFLLHSFDDEHEFVLPDALRSSS